MGFRFQRNIIIASVIGATALISGIKYKQHQDRASFSNSCSQMRKVRLETAGLMGEAMTSGYSGLSAKATVLMQDATDMIERCNALGY